MSRGEILTAHTWRWEKLGRQMKVGLSENNYLHYSLSMETFSFLTPTTNKHARHYRCCVQLSVSCGLSKFPECLKGRFIKRRKTASPSVCARAGVSDTERAGNVSRKRPAAQKQSKERCVWYEWKWATKRQAVSELHSEEILQHVLVVWL